MCLTCSKNSVNIIMKNIVRVLVLIVIFGGFFVIQEQLEAQSREYDKRLSDLINERKQASNDTPHEHDSRTLKDLEIFDNLQVCKATIATIMGQVPKSMDAKVKADKVAIVSYVRSDGTRWSYECEVVGARVNWGRVGRDRIQSNVVITENTVGQVLKVTQHHSDGSVTVGNYTKTELM